MYANGGTSLNTVKQRRSAFGKLLMSMVLAQSKPSSIESVVGLAALFAITLAEMPFGTCHFGIVSRA
jgi:hypothetical protein